MAIKKRDSVQQLAHLLKGWNADEKDFDREEFAKGLLVEREHSNQREIQAAIVKSHLLENPHYYSDMERCGLT